MLQLLVSSTQQPKEGEKNGENAMSPDETGVHTLFNQLALAQRAHPHAHPPLVPSAPRPGPAFHSHKSRKTLPSAHLNNRIPPHPTHTTHGPSHPTSLALHSNPAPVHTVPVPITSTPGKSGRKMLTTNHAHALRPCMRGPVCMATRRESERGETIPAS